MKCEDEYEMSKCTWTLPCNAQKSMNDELEKLNIFNTPKKPLYHYTSREVFWKIIEEECLLARHILFSNDYKENEIGKSKMETALKEINNNMATSDALPFMICFCEEPDLLSQWRGYAKEGVAIEFDFSKGLYGLQSGFSSNYCYTIMDVEKKKEYLSTDDLVVSDKLFMGAVVSPYAVFYTGEDKDPDGIIKQKVNKIFSDAPEERRQQYAISMIPYIKSNHFQEEKEYRLIFDMRQLVADKSQLLSQKYMYLDVDGVKKPNIRVKFGNQYNAKYEENITIYYSDKQFETRLKKFKKDLLKEKIKINLIRKPRKFRMGSDEMIISEGCHQEQICIRLRHLLYKDKIKIWCDGHMPIRRIIVGPSKDAKFMKSSIEEYLKTKFWMRDIEVKISDIPLRT